RESESGVVRRTSQELRTIAHRVAGAGVERDLVAGGYAYEDVPTRSWHPHDTRPVAGVEVARPLDVFVNVLEDLAEGHVLAEGLKELLHVLLPRARLAAGGRAPGEHRVFISDDGADHHGRVDRRYCSVDGGVGIRVFKRVHSG